jgi:hypothetical protein
MKISAVLACLTRSSHLWAFVFVYTVGAGLLVQLALLPRIFPAWHAGHGLITGVDGLRFHRAALEMAQLVERAGWSAWELDAGGQAVSGIAAIFYVLIYPEPWSVLPVNGLLNATACVCLYRVLARLSGDRLRSVLAAVPFILFPSSLLWNAQFHNENYAVPGVVCLLYGWMILARPATADGTASLRQIAGGLALIATGSVLLGIVRAYILNVMAYLVVLPVVGVVVWAAIRRTRLGAIVSLTTVLGTGAALMMLVTQALGDAPRETDARETEWARPSAEAQVTSGSRKWNPTPWLPDGLDRQLRGISAIRRQSVRLSQPGDSGIDTAIRMRSAGEVVAYAPRALQIALLSPFPSMWFSEGTKDSGTAMRAVSAFEMILVYLGLLGLPLFLRRHRSDPALWFVLFICAGMLVLYAMTVTNVGALYRFRYPFLMPIVSMGVAGWLALRAEAPESATGVKA